MTTEQQQLRYPTAHPWLGCEPVGPPLALGEGSGRVYSLAGRFRAVVWRGLETYDVSEWSSAQGAYRWTGSTLRGLHRSASIQ